MYRHCSLIFLFHALLETAVLSDGANRALSSSVYSNQLDEMTLYLLKKFVSDYELYGCWCNYMNRGNVNNAAVDAIDQCCLEHYSCYRQLSMSTECVPVSVTAYDTILRKGTVTCMDTVNSCAYSVCACDKQMADCFKTQNQAYNASKFKNVTKEECKPAVTTTTLATEAVCDAFQKPPLINSSCTKPQWSWSGAYLATIGIFGTPGSSAQHFSSPLGIFIDQYDNLFVADSGNHRVQKFLPNSKTGITVAGGNGQGNAVNQLNNPTNIFVDVDGNLYISDSGNSRVQKWLLNSRQGITVVNMSSTPGGIFVNRQGDIYVSEIYGQKVMKYPMNSDVGTVVASNLRRPRGIFVDECDAVYVADDLDHCIYKFIKGNTTGVVVAGVKGISSFWPYTQTVNLNSPSYVTVDQYGNMYLLDSSDARIQRVSKKDGQMTTIGGRTTANNQNNPISMDHPIGMAFDSKSNLYISDSLDRVQKFEFIGGDLYC